MKKLLLSLTLLFAATWLVAQNSPVTWTFEAKKTTAGEYDLVLHAAVGDGWYIYSQYLESDDGPVRTQIAYDAAAMPELLGKSTEDGDKLQVFDELFGMNIIKFKHNFNITQHLKPKGNKITGHVTFMTCNNQQCLPPRDVDFSVEVPK